MNYSIEVSWHNVDCYYKNLPVKQVVLHGKNEQDCFVEFFKKNNSWKLRYTVNNDGENQI